MKTEIKNLLSQDRAELAINAFCKLSHERTSGYDYLFVTFYGPDARTEKISARDWREIVAEVSEKQTAYYVDMATMLNKKLASGTLFNGSCAGGLTGSPLLTAWKAEEERETEHQRLRTPLDALTETKYIVVDEERFPSGELRNVWTHVYDDPEEATSEAEHLWDHLTSSERKHRRIFFAAIAGKDLADDAMDEDGAVDWECWESCQEYEGSFDSNFAIMIAKMEEEV